RIPFYAQTENLEQLTLRIGVAGVRGIAECQRADGPRGRVLAPVTLREHARIGDGSCPRRWAGEGACPHGRQRGNTTSSGDSASARASAHVSAPDSRGYNRSPPPTVGCSDRGFRITVEDKDA